jgi:hypothetical protein
VEISRLKLEKYFNISQIGINECLNSDQQCFAIGCLNKIEIQTKQPYLINANQTSFVGLNIRTIAQCACDTDVNIQQEKQKEQLKTHKYCLNGGYPIRDNHQIKCMCPDNSLYNGGERCQLTSISFDGKLFCFKFRLSDGGGSLGNGTMYRKSALLFSFKQGFELLPSMNFFMASSLRVSWVHSDSRYEKRLGPMSKYTLRRIRNTFDNHLREFTRQLNYTKNTRKRS